MKERVKSGLWMGGGRIPFGYDYDDKQGILVPNKDSDKVRMAYELYCQGKSYQDVADILGLTTEVLARNILNRKTYIGIIEYNGEEYIGKHQPIITQELYDKTQYILKHRSCNKFSFNSNYLLTGLITCGKCGAKMRYQKWGKTPDKVKFVCYSQQATKKYLIKDPNCDQPKLWVDEVERQVINYMFEFAENYKLINSKADQISKNETNMMDLLSEKINALEKKIKRLYNLYAESDDDLLLESISELKGQLSNVQKEYDEENNRHENISKAKECIDTLMSVKSIWNTLSNNDKHSIITHVIKEIVITDNVIDIHFML